MRIEDQNTATDRFPTMEPAFMRFCELMQKRKIQDLYLLVPMYKFLRAKYPDLPCEDWPVYSIVDNDYVKEIVGDDLVL